MAEDLAEGHPREPEEGAGGLSHGWRPDPFGRHTHRWWDGEAWTASATSGGGVVWDPAPVSEVVLPSPGLRGVGIAVLGYGAGIGLSVLVALAIVGLDLDLSRAAELLVSSLALWAGLLAAVVFVSVRRGTGSLVRDYGLRIRWSDLGFGLAGALVGRLVAGMAIAPIPLFDPDLGEDDRVVFEGATDDGWSWLVLALVVCVGAPLVEEVFFRGLLQNRLVARWGLAAGLIVSSVLFGAAHLIAWDGAGTAINAWAVTFAGLVFGLTYHYARRLGAVIVAHGLFNAVAVVALWATT